MTEVSTVDQQAKRQESTSRQALSGAWPALLLPPRVLMAVLERVYPLTTHTLVP